MSIKRSIVIAILFSAIAGSIAFAVSREPDRKEPAGKMSKGTPLKGNIQSAVVSTPSVTGKGSGQTEPVALQPVKPRPTVAAAPKAQLAGEQISWQVISGGGGGSVSGNFVLSATVGQTAVGEITSASYSMNQGFWQKWVSGCCVGTTGNTDGSAGDVVDISDVFAVVDYLGASIPLSSCTEENDVNIDGTVDISDLFSLIDFLSGVATLPVCP